MYYINKQLLTTHKYDYQPEMITQNSPSNLLGIRLEIGKMYRERNRVCKK